ncbi:Fc.00g106150.m01.CDS01 [Cosmosporella sp. VM-42]
MRSGNPDCTGCDARLKNSWLQLDELKENVEEECPYCSLLLRGILHLVPNIEERFGHDATFRFKSLKCFTLYADPNGSLPYKPDREELAFRWEYHSASSNPSNLPPGDTSSDMSFAKARQWMEYCSTKHMLCGSDEPSQLPTRILHLEDGSGEDPKRIRLVEASERKEKYISLSHSWGNEQPLTTTMATLEDRKAGIDIAQLPQTFQDAVRITQRLGIRYLWIDSLCIIQDSAEDWQVEASRMASIYRNSWLTVSATRSASTKSGCFSKDQVIDVEPPMEDDDVLSVLFPAASELRQELRLNLRFAISHPDFDKYARPEANEAFPLLNRAWGYQERLLAPRVLHFGPQELFWECMQDLDCECGTMKWSREEDMGGYINRDTSEALPPKISHYAALHVGGKRKIDDKKRRRKLLGRWEDMVHEYSQRKLSFAKDRLPAFSGIAAEMIEVLGMGYRAGLWLEAMPQGLLWERDNCAEIGWPMNQLRPAPSWSWASVDAPVTFLVPQHEQNNRGNTVIHAEVEEIRVIPNGKDERGEVKLKESFAILFAETVHPFFCFEPDFKEIPEMWMYVRTAIKKGIKCPPPRTRRAFQLRVGQSDPVMFVPDVAPCDKDGNWTWGEEDELCCSRILDVDGFTYWLVLRQLDKATLVYERVGVVGTSIGEWKCKGGKQRIKII